VQTTDRLEHDIAPKNAGEADFLQAHF